MDWIWLYFPSLIFKAGDATVRAGFAIPKHVERSCFVVFAWGRCFIWSSVSINRGVEPLSHILYYMSIAGVGSCIPTANQNDILKQIIASNNSLDR